MRLLSSPEFRRRSNGLEGRQQPGGRRRRARARAAGPRTGRPVRARAYECLLGRPADESGFRHYAAALAAGETRTNLLRSLAVSDEFEQPRS